MAERLEGPLAMRRTITGFSNPTVKLLRSLARQEAPQAPNGMFLAEGLRLLTDALESGPVPKMLVMARQRDPHPLLDGAGSGVTARAGGEVIETSPDILCKITGKDNPQGVAGVFDEFDTSLAGLDRGAAPIWLVAQALRDPGNLGTMLRTGDAMGAGGLILIDDCADPFSVEAVRASMGAVFTQRIARARVGANSCRGCAAGRGSWWRRACAMRCPIAARPMPRRASCWSATNRAGCRRNTRRPATCA